LHLWVEFALKHALEAKGAVPMPDPARCGNIVRGNVVLFASPSEGIQAVQRLAIVLGIVAPQR